MTPYEAGFISKLAEAGMTKESFAWVIPLLTRLGMLARSVGPTVGRGWAAANKSRAGGKFIEGVGRAGKYVKKHPFMSTLNLGMGGTMLGAPAIDYLAKDPADPGALGSQNQAIQTGISQGTREAVQSEGANKLLSDYLKGTGYALGGGALGGGIGALINSMGSDYEIGPDGKKRPKRRSAVVPLLGAGVGALAGASMGGLLNRGQA